MTIPEYLQNINRRYISGISREHTYRGDLQTLLESIATGVEATNEPALIACGVPDYVLTKKDIPIGYVEAKDIGPDRCTGLHLCSTAQSGLPRKIQRVFKDRFSTRALPNRCTGVLAAGTLGGELRQLHLLESPKVQQYITQYPEDDTNVVGKIRFKPELNTNTGKVWINEAQYCDGVPQTAWNFYIGGYEPAQKWMKDRKDRELSFEDILHYQQMIVTLTETWRMMGGD